MKLLILGGTIFLGRHLVNAAKERGHEVTLFNRGKHNPELFPDIEKIHGERDGGLEALAGRTWDAVVDTCGYVPRIVKQSAEFLADRAAHYTFISSISAYSDVSKPDMDESGPTGTLDDAAVEQITGETYGPLKVLCEEAAERVFPGRALNIRPGLIVGPHDPSDRYTYWPVRIARGGDILTPTNHEAPIQIIDGRDLAEWNIRMIEEKKTGLYNATGPDTVLTFGAMLAACPGAARANFVRIPEEWLNENEVSGWSDLPTWLPDTEEYRGFSRINCKKAINDGLTFRSIETIAEDTLEWAAKRPEDYEMKAGLKPDREKELLSKWMAGNA